MREASWPPQNVSLTIERLLPGARAGDNSAMASSTKQKNNNAILPLPPVHPTFGPENATGSSTDNTRRKAHLHIRCPYHDCHHNGTFSRQWELDRHVRVKHEGKRPFTCPLVGCFKGKAAPSFARSDKLTAHIRATHQHQNSRLLVRPHENCKKLELELGHFWMHIQQRHKDRFGLIADEHLRAVKNAISPYFPHCPLLSCRKCVSLTSFQSHALSHSQAEIESMAANLGSAGYALIELPQQATESQEGTNATGSPFQGPILAIQILCPMCGVGFSKHEGLQFHIDETHLVAQDQQKHFKYWRDYCESYVFRALLPQQLKPWEEWNIFDFVCHTLVCSHCNYSTKEGKDSDVYHQKSMLANLDEIKPYRWKILALYPQFSSHPVWSDFAQRPSGASLPIYWTRECNLPD